MLGCDSSGILRRLLKYPPVEGVICIVNMAESYLVYILGGCVSARPAVLAYRNPRLIDVPRTLSQLGSSNIVNPSLATHPVHHKTESTARTLASSTSEPILRGSRPAVDAPPPLPQRSPLQTFITMLSQLQLRSSKERPSQDKMSHAIELVKKLDNEKPSKPSLFQ